MVVFSEFAHVKNALLDAEVIQLPFPHVYITNVFSSAFYNALCAGLDGQGDVFMPLNETGRVTRGYSSQRHVRRSLGVLSGVIESGLTLSFLGEILLDKFHVTDAHNLRDEILVLRDLPGYSLGPHTDAIHKVVSCLFYLARDDTRPELGTAFYKPKDPAFRCAGGPHYPFTKFDWLKTFPYVPNAMLAFVKSDESFHGVEPFTKGQRDLLLYDIRRKA
jgi:hypothetical protein